MLLLQSRSRWKTLPIFHPQVDTLRKPCLSASIWSTGGLYRAMFASTINAAYSEERIISATEQLTVVVVLEAIPISPQPTTPHLPLFSLLHRPPSWQFHFACATHIEQKTQRLCKRVEREFHKFFVGSPGCRRS
jgi:hypothetical protein